MNKPYPFPEINSALAGVNSVGILLYNNPSFDAIAAGLALSLSLKKTGKDVVVASSTPMRVEFSHLVGVDKITNKIGSEKQQIISISYPIKNVATLTYDDSDKEKVNLIIKLKNDAPPISSDKISLKGGGKISELYFLIGGENQTDFETLTSLQEIQSQNSIAITKNQNTNLGKVRVIDPTASSYSEIITAILVSLSLPSDQDIAQNLFLGLSTSTANFSSQAVSADTFEAAALCLRAGASRKPTPGSNSKQFTPTETTQAETSLPSPDWLKPKIYKTQTPLGGETSSAWN